MPVENGRFQQTCRSTPSVVQQFVKYCHAACVRGEPCVGVADGAVGLSFVIPNGTLRPRHELPLLFPELNLLTWRALKGTADVRCGTDAPRPEVATCPLFSPELDNGEEHCKIMVRHGQGIRQWHPCPNAAPQIEKPSRSCARSEGVISYRGHRPRSVSRSPFPAVRLSMPWNRAFNAWKSAFAPRRNLSRRRCSLAIDRSFSGV
jgi:hypothetical protein